MNEKWFALMSSGKFTIGEKETREDNWKHMGLCLGITRPAVNKSQLPPCKPYHTEAAELA
jgi:hypothetical protein